MQPPLTAPNSPINSEGQKPSQEGTSESNPPPLKHISVHTGTPWPKAGKMSGNLFKLRKDWLIPPTNNTATATISKPPTKIEAQAQEQPTPNTTAPPKAEQYGWGLNCPICKNIEDWDGDHQKQFQQSSPQSQQPQIQGLQYPETQNYQKPQSFQHSQSQTFDVSDRYSNQLKLHRE